MDLRRAAAQKDLASTLQSLVSKADCRQFSGLAVRRVFCLSAIEAWTKDQPASIPTETCSELLGAMEGFRQPGLAAAFLEAAQKVGGPSPRNSVTISHPIR